jgi:hypothetical protein
MQIFTCIHGNVASRTAHYMRDGCGVHQTYGDKTMPVDATHRRATGKPVASECSVKSLSKSSAIYSPSCGWFLFFFHPTAHGVAWKIQMEGWKICQDDRADMTKFSYYGHLLELI